MNTESIAPDPAPPSGTLLLGALRIDPATGEVTGPGGREQLDPKVMQVLLELVRRMDEVVPREELLAGVWPGMVVTDDVLRRCIYQLRAHLRRAGGDDRYKSVLETLPKRGYRLHRGLERADHAAAAGAGRRRRMIAAAAALVAVALGLWWATSLRDDPPGNATPPSIAVLPFADLSDAQDQQYFAEGLAEEILNLLAQLPGLRVIARTSSFSFRGRADLDIPEIGRQLDVTHLLEGSVRRSKNRVRVTAQLVRSSDGSHVWSRTYDRDQGDLLEMQSEIAGAIARTLEIRLTDAALQSNPRAVDPAAHEDFLHARFLFGRRLPGDLAAAQRHLQRAVLLEPAHGPAWALLSGVVYIRIFEEDEDPETALEIMRNAVERALALSPGNGEVHARAAQYYRAIGDASRAAEHLERAVALDPENLLVLAFLAGTTMWAGEFEKAVEYQRRVVEHDPVGYVVRWNLVGYLGNAGRYEEAWREFQRARELNPTDQALQLREAELLVLLGRHDQAHEAVLKLPDSAERERLIAIVADRLGRPAEAEDALAALRARGDAGGAQGLAEYFAWRGDSDAAFEWLGRARTAMLAAGRTPGDRIWPVHLIDSGFLHPLHGDPRFEQYFVRPDRRLGVRLQAADAQGQQP